MPNWHKRRTRWMLALAAWPVVTLAHAAQIYTYRAGFRIPISFADALRFPSVEFFFWAVAAPLIYDLALKYPLSRKTWHRNLPILAAFALGNDLIHGLYRAPLHWFVYPVEASKGHASLVALIKSYAIGNFTGDLGYFAVIVALAHAVLASQRHRDQEHAWAQDRQQVLEAQLHPHFLYNTLNSIATLMHEDVDAADEMMTKLATLLRRTLNRNGAYEIPLREELEILEIYLDIQRTRFEDRLTTVVSADPEILDVMVPRLILQPLVENAVRHGISRRTGSGRIEVRAWRENGALNMTVLNDGAGFDPAALGDDGLGLANTRARLAQHFQDRYHFDLRAGGDGGALAEISIPVRTCAVN
jgi:two-component system LytT family sensor kinase